MYSKTDLKAALAMIVLLSAVLVSGCSTSQADGKKSTVNPTMNKNNPEKLEPVSSVSFDGEQISLSVISTGCTSAEDFIVEHKAVDGFCRVTISRSVPDMCRRAPFIADFKLDWVQPESCNELQVVIDNPILVIPADGFLSKRLK